MAAARALRFLPLWFLLLSCYAVTAASERPPCASLPDPAPMNDFLLHSSPRWTNPPFGGEPRPLQVIKCKSLAGEGPKYEFYQVEVPSRACKSPPPLVKSVAAIRGEVDTKGYFIWAWYLGWILSVTWNVVSGVAGLSTAEICFVALAWLVCMMLLAVVGGAWFWVRRISAELCQSLEVASSSPPQSASSPDTIEDDVSKGPVTSERPLSLWWRAFKALFTFLWAGLGALICGAAVLASAIALLFLVAGPILAVGFVICKNSSGSPQREGTPVSLPDPNQAGLDHYLSSQQGGMNLTLCTTQNLQFYVACPAASCAQLGEPYGRRPPAGEPYTWPSVVPASCPSRFGPFKTETLRKVAIVSLPLTIGIPVFIGFILCLESDRKRQEAHRGYY